VLLALPHNQLLDAVPRKQALLQVVVPAGAVAIAFIQTPNSAADPRQAQESFVRATKHVAFQLLFTVELRAATAVKRVVPRPPRQNVVLQDLLAPLEFAKVAIQATVPQ